MSTKTSIDCHFHFMDLQSGVKFYEIAVFRKVARGAVRVFPATTEWQRSDQLALQPDITTVAWEGTLDARINTRHQTRFVSLHIPASLTSDNVLLTGAMYFVRVRAYNYAGLMLVADSNGVKIDDTPPIITQVSIGVLNNDPEDVRTEEATGDVPVVVVADAHGIKSAWLAVDPESGVQSYYLAVGDVPLTNPLQPYYSPGNQDLFSNNSNFFLNCSQCFATSVSRWLPGTLLPSDPHSGYVAMGLRTSSYIDLSPLSLDVDSALVRYAVTVAAVNGADLDARRSSKPLRVARKDVAGVVYDGPDFGVDISLQSGDTVTATFFGWKSDYCGGLMGFEWAVGSTPGGTDIQKFSPEGLTMMGDHGSAQALTLGLRQNGSHYATVRGITMCRVQGLDRFDMLNMTQGPAATRVVEFQDNGNQFIESVSSGVLTDKSPPAFTTSPTITSSVVVDQSHYRQVDSGATILLAGVSDNTTINVQVEAEDGRTQDYYVLLQSGAPSSDALLSNLTVVRPATLGMLGFTANVYSYGLLVPYAVKQITLAAVPHSLFATMTVGRAGLAMVKLASGAESEPLKLLVGPNPLVVRVVAQDGLSVHLYTMNITRRPAKTNATLDSVAISIGNSLPIWTQTRSSSSPQTYTVTIPFWAQTVSLTANFSSTVLRASAAIQIDPLLPPHNRPLSSGFPSDAIPFSQATMIITVWLLAEDATNSSEVVLHLVRALPDSSTALGSLAATLPAGAPGLAPVVNGPLGSIYTVLVDFSCETIVLHATPASVRASIRFNLTVAPALINTSIDVLGSGLLRLDVIAESGATRPYLLNITHRAPSNNSGVAALFVYGVSSRNTSQLLATFDAAALATQQLAVSDVEFSYSSLTLVLEPAHPFSQVQLSEDNFGLQTELGQYPASGPVNLAFPPVYTTLPYPFVAPKTLVARMVAEDGISSSTNFTIELSYQLPDTNPRLQNFSVAFAYQGRKLVVGPTPIFIENTTLYRADVPFSVLAVELRGQAVWPSSATAGLAGSAQQSLDSPLVLSVQPSDTEIALQALAQDRLTVAAFTLIVTRNSPSNASDLSVRAMTDRADVAVVTMPSPTSFEVTVPLATRIITITATSFLFANITCNQFSARGELVATISVVELMMLCSVQSESGLSIENYTITTRFLPGNAESNISSMTVFTDTFQTNLTFLQAELWDGAVVSASVAFSTTSVYLRATSLRNTSTLQLQTSSSVVGLKSGSATSVLLDKSLVTNIVVRCTSQAGTVLSITVQFTRIAANTNANLGQLSLPGFELQPSFSANVSRYVATTAGTQDVTLMPKLPVGVFFSRISVGFVEYLSGDFSQQADGIQLQWGMADAESGITNTSLGLGYAPWSPELASATCPGNTLCVYSLQQLGLTANRTVSGLPITAAVTGSNQLNETVAQLSNSVTIDTTVPLVDSATVVCPTFQSEISSVTCQWYGFRDQESPLTYFLFSVGLVPGDSSLFASTFIGWTHSYTAQVSLQHGQRIFVTVTAINAAGLQASVSSSAVMVDTTPPMAGSRVWEVGDYARYVPQTSEQDAGAVDVLQLNYSSFRYNTAYAVGDVVSWNGTLFRAIAVFDSGERNPVSDLRWSRLEDQACQRSRSRVHVKWDAFVDPESGIDHYELALGTTIGGHDVTQGWIMVDPDVTSYVVVQDTFSNNIVLTAGTTVYARVKAVNGVNESCSLASNGVGIAVLQIAGTVLDGSGGTDAVFQSDIRTVSAFWSTNDPCEVRRVEVRLVRYAFANVSVKEGVTLCQMVGTNSVQR